MKKWVCLSLIIIIFLSSCAKKDDLENSSVSGTLDSTSSGDSHESGQAITGSQVFPHEYNRKSESGKVIFSLSPEYPETVSDGKCIIPEVNGHLFTNSDQVYDLFVKDKPVQEMIEQQEEDDNFPSITYYILEDGSSVNTGGDLNYSSGSAKFYGNVRYYDNLGRFTGGGLDFASPEEAVNSAKETLTSFGISPDIFSFSTVALDHKTMQELEDEKTVDENVPGSNEKKNWTTDDDAYYIYAFQTEKGIPIFNEEMSFSHTFADYSPSNACIQGILATSGWVKLQTVSIYDLSWENEKETNLKPFEEIAKTVEEKYEMLLTDSRYEINRACFAIEVSLNASQKYEAIPIWYFEVVENDTNLRYVWVNAVTGEEIYLK